jgi:membrane-bound lytic murein transglycosylase B
MDRGDGDQTPEDQNAATLPLIRPPVEPDPAPERVSGDLATTVTRETPVPVAPRNGARWIVAVMLLALAVTAVVVGRSLIPRTVSTLAQVPIAPTTTAEPRSSAPVAPSPSVTAAPGPARPADSLATWAAKISGVTGVPAVAVQAYAYAQLTVRNTNPQCAIGWTTLAGIGEVQSHHGQAGGSVLDRNGRSTPPIVGPALNGQDGRPLVSDTDAGAFDSDPLFEHAMGPLMLLPAVWRANASDADSDAILDPYDIDDESLAVAKLLCAGGEDLTQRAGWNTAVARVQTGDAFAEAVFQAADSYGRRTQNVE